MNCASCGTALLPGKQFCHACGAAAVKLCSRCGSPLDAAFRFCPDCGQPTQAEPSVEVPQPPAAVPVDPSNPWTVLPPEPVTASAPAIPENLAQKILATRDAIEGERKLVTVLFCDLAGSTAIAEKLDPEEYRELLDRYVTLAFREIYRFEGIVNQLAGDGMMALFGAPVAHEDAPQRALLAALAIHAALAQLSQEMQREQGIELRARIGIHTGPVVVGNVGNDLKMDYTAIGDTTNLASRLESLAVPGSILISDETHALVRGFFEMEPAGPFEVKGKSAPVVAYRVLGERAVSHKFALATERGLTPLVGREQELAQLEACYERAKGGLPQVVEIVGETGSGRSRLVYELKQRIAPEPIVFEARCAALNQRASYSPWMTMLQQYFGIAAGECGPGACERVAAKFAQLDLYNERSVGYVLRVLGLVDDTDEQLPAEDIKRETFEAIGRIFYQESQRAPVLVIIEDLHWIDEPSREMLERAIGELARTRLMYVLTHRPEFRASWQTQAAVTSLNLRKLGDEAAQSIIRTVAGGELPADLVKLILSKSEGSPFFTEEITRSLLEGGYLTRVDEKLQLTRPVEEVTIPGTVQEVIAARLDRLPADSKRTLQVAAVLGRQFSREQLRHILIEEIDIDHALEDLESRGIVHRKNLFSNDLYRFGESLTQEVAYEGLLLRQRRGLHERIGALLEQATEERTEERSALVAHHFANSDNLDRAAAALLRAAQDAEKVPSYKSAARFYRDAWEMVRRDGRMPTGELARAAAAAALGVMRMAVFYNAVPSEEAVCIGQAGERIADELGLRETALSIAAFRGMVLISGRRDQFDAGLSLIEQTLATAQLSGIPMPGMARGAAWAYMMDGRFELARRTIEGAIREMEALPKYQHSDVFLGGLYLRDRICFFRDDFESARRGALATHELAIQASNRTVQGGTAATIALIHFYRGEYAEAKRWAERATELAKAVGNTLARTTEACIIVASRVALGEPRPPAKYVDMIEASLPAEGELNLMPGMVVTALLAVGAVDPALQFAQRVYDRASGRLRQVLAALALADATRHHDPSAPEAALPYYREAVSTAEAIGARSVLAAAHLGIAEIDVVAGDHGAARAHLDVAAEIVRDLGLARYQPRLELLLQAGEADTEVTQASA